MKIKSYKETIDGITYDVSYVEKFYCKIYCLNDKYHNESGPAIINYYPNGNIERDEYYYINNKLHNENGPAMVRYHKDSNIKFEQYYVFDIQFDSLEELQHYLKYKNF